MPGLWKAWKAKRQASHSFHEPLGNLAKGRRDSHIPTAPTTRADGKVENQKQVFHFPTAPNPSLSNAKTEARGRAVARHRARAGGAARRLQKTNEGDFSQHPITGSSRIGTKLLFQAHPALESILDFRLISGLENAMAPGARRA